MTADPPLPRRPAGFDAFWTATLDELADTPADFRRRPGGAAKGREADLEEIGFRSLGGQRIGAYLASRRDDRPRPLIIHGHGYGGPSGEVAWRWLDAGAHVCGVDVRGFGRSAAGAPARSAWGYILTGAESPHTSVLRGAACDYLRAAEVAREALGPRVSRIILHGGSFAGGLATMAEALRPRADLLVLEVPSLAWTEARIRLCRTGSGREIGEYLRARPDRAAATLRTLAFFDALHFAPQVATPAIVGLAERDLVVPPLTVAELHDRLAGPRELVRLPVAHSSSPLERCWERFESRWLQLALGRGAPEAGRAS